MGGAQKIEQALASGSVRAFEVAEIDKAGRFVEEHPVGDTVAQRLRDQLHVVGEAGGSVAVGPSSGVFQSLRQIPVIERDQRANAVLEQGIDEAAVVVDAFGIR